MKKFYVLSLCSLLCVSASAADARFKSKKGAPLQRVLKVEKAAAPVWRPASQSEFLFIEGEWMLMSETRFTYDANGNAIRQDIEDEDGLFCIESQFDSYGKPVSILQSADYGDGFENESKRTYKYDEILHDFYVERLGYDWNGEEWEENYYCETNKIVRNDAGSITSVEKALPYMGDMIPAYKAVWTYGDDATKAVEFAYFSNYNFIGAPDWQLYNETSYRNIEWEATDGQIVATSMAELVSGANKIKSAEVYYDGELDGHVFVSYSAENPADYVYKETYADPTVVGYSVSRETIDANGSFREITSEYFDEEGEPSDEPTYQIIREVVCDDHGNAVSEELFEAFEGMTELVDGAKIDYVYDKNGNPIEVTTSIYNYDDDEYVYDSRIVYDSYADVSELVTSP